MKGFPEGVVKGALSHTHSELMEKQNTSYHPYIHITKHRFGGFK